MNKKLGTPALNHIHYELRPIGYVCTISYVCTHDAISAASQYELMMQFFSLKSVILSKPVCGELQSWSRSFTQAALLP